MADIPFFKKIALPRFSLSFFYGKPVGVVGVDIGTHSAKVVQLRYEKERAILETYGELLAERYFKGGSVGGEGVLRYLDSDLSSLLQDLLRESNTTSKETVLAIPAELSFVTPISFPRISKKEIDQAMPFEARKYVPIPASEVVLDWEIMESEEGQDSTNVLLVAVPKEVVEKFSRIAELAGIQVRALEVETFSLVRSLVGTDPTPTALINFGSTSTTLSLVDRGRVKMSHNFSRGSQELTRALERGLGITRDRAEEIKKNTGISEKIEERDITSVIMPPLETLFAEIERMISLYNRRAPRKIQKINLTGGGSNLKGLVDYVSNKFGMEVTRGNPFARMVTPAFMQPILREIGPSFSVAAGLALREITTR